MNMQITADSMKWIVPILLILSIIFPVHGLPQYAEETGQECTVCHIDPSTGELNDVGKAYRISHTWPPEEEKSSQLIVFIFGFIHILSAVVWIGAIIFVHVIHTPDVVGMGGAPKKELILGWLGILGIGISGTVLTVHRFQSFESLLSSPAGITVFAKIIIFIFMTCTALILTFYLNRKFRESPRFPHDVNLDEFREYRSLKNEKDRVLVSVGGLVYDLTESPLWKDGVHAGKHHAWAELGEELKRSPHGVSVLKKFKPAGFTSEAYKKAKEAGRAFAIFRFFAYMNLIFGFILIALSAYLRWIV